MRSSSSCRLLKGLEFPERHGMEWICSNKWISAGRFMIGTGGWRFWHFITTTVGLSGLRHFPSSRRLCTEDHEAVAVPFPSAVPFHWHSRMHCRQSWAGGNCTLQWHPQDCAKGQRTTEKTSLQTERLSCQWREPISSELKRLPMFSPSMSCALLVGCYRVVSTLGSCRPIMASVHAPLTIQSCNRLGLVCFLGRLQFHFGSSVDKPRLLLEVWRLAKTSKERITNGWYGPM